MLVLDGQWKTFQLRMYPCAISLLSAESMGVASTPAQPGLYLLPLSLLL